MLAIDDLKKLADMQILLLKMTSKDRDINLEKYKSLVVQIDKYNFDNFLSNLDQINAHNQNLEVELLCLEQLRENYQQLLEQQLLYKNNYELYGGSEILLSDLSVINIDYIDIRINTINGYLVNKLNLENAKKKIEALNKELLLEEKNKNMVSNRLLQLESELRNNFINAEGRIVEDDRLKYISIVSEYKDLGYDVKFLLEDRNKLDELLSELNDVLFDVEEKLNVAEICYKADLTDSNLKVFDEIKFETLMVRYKLSMLKILNLVSLDYNDYNLFKKKREDLLSLISFRLNCLKELNIHMSIDPFGRIKINEQMDIVSMFDDCTENICRIKREISQSDEILENLLFKNNEFMIELSNTKDTGDLILKVEEKDISNVDDEEILLKDDEKLDDSINVLDNQVVMVKDLSEKFNIAIVSQKTNKVIKRVNEMVNSVNLLDLVKREESYGIEEISPELVIVEDTVDLNKDDSLMFVENDSVDSLFGNFSLNNEVELSTVEVNKDLDEVNTQNIEVVFENEEMDDKIETKNNDIEIDADALVNDKVVPVLSIDESEDNIDSDIFLTVDPFLETSFFDDRVDEGYPFSIVDNIVEDDILLEQDNNVHVNNNDVEKTLDSTIVDNKIVDLQEEMPDAFWVVGDEDESEKKEELVLSFDEQVDELLAEDNKNKIRKLAA